MDFFFRVHSSSRTGMMGFPKVFTKSPLHITITSNSIAIFFIYTDGSSVVQNTGGTYVFMFIGTFY